MSGEVIRIDTEVRFGTAKRRGTGEVSVLMKVGETVVMFSLEEARLVAGGLQKAIADAEARGRLPV